MSFGCGLWMEEKERSRGVSTFFSWLAKLCKDSLRVVGYPCLRVWCCCCMVLLLCGVVAVWCCCCVVLLLCGVDV